MALEAGVLGFIADSMAASKALLLVLLAAGLGCGLRCRQHPAGPRHSCQAGGGGRRGSG
jgi:hypothetical protein